MKKLIIKIVIAIVAILVLSVALDGFLNKFSFLNKFKGLFTHELSIDKTANVVTQIKEISEFTTACYYEELVIQKEKYSVKEKNAESSVWNKVKQMAGVNVGEEEPAAPDSTLDGRLVLIVKSKVRAGYDLSKVEENDIVLAGDTLSIKLPEPEIFDIIVNPSDWEIYYRKGDWADDEIRNIQSGAKDEIKQDAIDYGLLEKAVSSGKESLKSLFKTIGVSEVILQ